MKYIFNILKFLSKEIIAKILYKLYLLFLDPRLFYKTVVISNIEILVAKFNSSRKNFNYNSIKDFLINKFKSLFAIKGVLLLIRIILYLNAIFGAGIILFHVNPINELLNYIINLIHYYCDNPVVNLILSYWYSFLRKFKLVLDSISKLIDSVVPNENINSDNNLPSSTAEDKLINNGDDYSLQNRNSVSTTPHKNLNIDGYNLRNDYYLPTEDHLKESGNNSDLRKWLLITGVILIIGGLVCYNWDSIIYYFNYKTIKTDSPDLSPTNSTVTSNNSNNFNSYFRSPSPSHSEISSTGSSSSSTTISSDTPSSSGSSTPTLASSGSSTITLATSVPSNSSTALPLTSEDIIVKPASPLPLKVKIASIDKYNPSYPSPEAVTPVTVNPVNVTVDPNKPLIDFLGDVELH
jgi:hypothetical protein